METNRIVLTMPRLFIIIIAQLPLISTAIAQENQSGQFDFWIGRWHIEQKILDKNGDWLEYEARTEVKYILNKQAIEEHWHGEVRFFWEGMAKPQQLEGYSLRYYDEDAGKWLIYWMDSRHPAVKEPFAGTFTTASHGEFFRTTYNSEEKTIARITFDLIDEHTVDWKLAISKDGSTWQTLWTMLMRRK